MAPAVAAAIITGVAGAGTAVYVANKQGHAADTATAAQTTANANALDFEKQQAAQTQTNFDTTQRANYDQWAARQNQLSSLGQIAGLAPRPIPPYVSTTTPSTAPGGQPTSGPTSATPAAPGSYDPRLVALYQQHGATPSGPGSGLTDIAYWNSKISAPGADVNYFLTRLGSDLAGTGPDAGSGGGPRPSAQPGSAAALLYPNVQAPGVPYVRTPGLGTLSAYAGM